MKIRGREHNFDLISHCFPLKLHLHIRVSHFSNFFEFHLPNLGSHSIPYLKEESKCMAEQNLEISSGICTALCVLCL